MASSGLGGIPASGGHARSLLLWQALSVPSVAAGLFAIPARRGTSRSDRQRRQALSLRLLGFQQRGSVLFHVMVGFTLGWCISVLGFCGACGKICEIDKPRAFGLRGSRPSGPAPRQPDALFHPCRHCPPRLTIVEATPRESAAPHRPPPTEHPSLHKDLPMPNPPQPLTIDARLAMSLNSWPLGDSPADCKPAKYV